MENWGNIRSGAGSQPIDRAYNALIAFSMAFKIRILFVWRGNGDDGDTRVVGDMLGTCLNVSTAKRRAVNSIKAVWERKADKLPSSCVLCLPCKCSAKNPIHGTHEVNDNTFLKFLLETKFLTWVSGIINEVINIDADMDWCPIRFITGGGRRSDNAREQTGFMFRCCKTHIFEGLCKHVKPMVW